MNAAASQFMDKQIMGLSGGAQGFDFLGLSSSPPPPPPEDHHRHHRSSNGAIKGKEVEDILLPSYNFLPIRTAGSADSQTGPYNFRNYGSLEPHESNVIHEKAKDAHEYDTSIVPEIDHTVKKHADILLHAMEGVSSRLSQLEARTRHLGSAVDDLRLDVENNYGITAGKLRQLENVLREVQTGVQVLLDKQEVAEAQMQLAKLQTSKGEHQLLESSNTTSDSRQWPVPPQQQLQQPPQHLVAPPLPPQLPVLSAPPVPNAPPPPLQNPPAQFPPQITHPQIPSTPSLLPQGLYYPPPGQLSEDTQQHYQPAPPQQPQLPPPPQHYQPSPQPPYYSQPAQPSLPINPPRSQPPLRHHPEEPAPHVPPPQAYPPSVQILHLPGGTPPSQQLYQSSTNIHEPSTSRSVSGPLFGWQSHPSGYAQPSGPGYSDSCPYSGSPKPSPFPSPTAPSGGSNHPSLPTAKILPQTLPTGSGSGSGLGGDGGGNRVPIDDVVDRVTTMGFPRDLVRATVRKLTENGQSVELNVVLDKLMNDNEHQPQKSFFGR